MAWASKHKAKVCIGASLHLATGGMVMALALTLACALAPPWDWHGHQPSRVGQEEQTEVQAGVAMVLIVRDEQEEYIHEWVQHHVRLNVGKIYLYDDLSEPPVNSLHAVMQYARAGLLEYHQVDPTLSSDPNRQVDVYTRCLRDFGHRHQWMGFTDIDEFVILKGAAMGMDLPTFLANYSQHAGLAIQWRLFGSSLHEHRPSGGVLANYVQCFPPAAVQVTDEARIVKLFVQPQHVDYVGPHFAALKGDRRVVDEGGRPVGWSKHPVLGRVSCLTLDWWAGERITLHHYVTRSKADYEEKMVRGGAFSGEPGKRWVRRWEFWERTNGLSVDICTDGLDATPDQAAANRTRQAMERWRREQVQLGGPQAGRQRIQELSKWVFKKPSLGCTYDDETAQ